VGEPLFVLCGGATAVDDQKLRTRRRIRRTMGRICCLHLHPGDIALKALSPASINPGHGRARLDQINRLL
jgi:hypothetical protein